MSLQRATPAEFYGKSQDERELVKSDPIRLFTGIQNFTAILRSWEGRARLPNGVECCWYSLAPILHLPAGL